MVHGTVQLLLLIFFLWWRDGIVSYGLSQQCSSQTFGVLHTYISHAHFSRRPVFVVVLVLLVVVVLMSSFDFSAAVIERLQAEKESNERTRLDDGVEFRVRVLLCV